MRHPELAMLDQRTMTSAFLPQFWNDITIEEPPYIDSDSEVAASVPIVGPSWIGYNKVILEGPEMVRKVLFAYSRVLAHVTLNEW